MKNRLLFCSGFLLASTIISSIQSMSPAVLAEIRAFKKTKTPTAEHNASRPPHIDTNSGQRLKELSSALEALSQKIVDPQKTAPPPPPRKNVKSPQSSNVKCPKNTAPEKSQSTAAMAAHQASFYKVLGDIKDFQFKTPAKTTTESVKNLVLKAQIAAIKATENSKIDKKGLKNVYDLAEQALNALANEPNNALQIIAKYIKESFKEESKFTLFKRRYAMELSDNKDWEEAQEVIENED